MIGVRLDHVPSRPLKFSLALAKVPAQRNWRFPSRSSLALSSALLLAVTPHCSGHGSAGRGLEMGAPTSAGAGGSGGSTTVPVPTSTPTTGPMLEVPTGGSGPMTTVPGELPIGSATLGGTVWAPGNGPGYVPSGQEIPVSGALVQISAQPIVALSDGVHCDQCVAPSGRYVLSDTKGRFELPQLPSGQYLLTIRKGQFALQKPIEIKEAESKQLAAELSTLPSIHSPGSGTWVPRVAIATGMYDSIENVLGKMGLGGVAADGTWVDSGPGAERIDTYNNGGSMYGRDQGDISALVRDIDTLRKYEIVFIPCSDIDPELLHDPKVLANLRQYVTEGGKLYVTDWSGSWHDNVFPAQVTFDGQDAEGNAVDTPATAYDPAMNHWDTSKFGLTEGLDQYESTDAKALDPDLFGWLNGQVAPLSDGSTGPIDAGNMTLTDNWNTIASVNDTVVGLDAKGNQVLDKPKVFVQGSRDFDRKKTPHPMTLTYQPAGCGRVLYSTYHTSQEPHLGLLPQERILLYLIMEISVCRVEPVPVTPVLK